MTPNKKLPKFYKGLTYEDVRWINAASKEDLRTLSFDQVRELFESQAAAQKTWHSSRRATTKKVETFGDGIRDEEMSTVKGQIASIHTQVGALAKAFTSMQMGAPSTVTVVRCGICQGNHHHTDKCQLVQETADVNYIGNSQGYDQSQMFYQGNQYRQGDQNQSNNWRPSRPPGFDQKKPAVEDALASIMSFMSESKKDNEHYRKDIDQFKKDVVDRFHQVDATMKSMQTQIGQIATALNTRQPGGLPSDTVTNPKGDVEHCNTVTLRSGRELGATSVSPNTLHAGADKVLGSRTSHAGADEASERTTAVSHEVAQGREWAASGSKDFKIGGFSNSAKNKEKLSPARDLKSPFNFPDHLPPPPFPLAGKKKPQSVEWMKEILKMVNVEVSLMDLMANFPKFFTLCKDLISKKKKTPKEGMVQVRAQCSQI